MFNRPMLMTAIVMLAAPLAHPQINGNAARGFEGADSNQDGVVTREEYIAARRSTFNRMDRNGDEHLDDQDLPKRRMARRQAGDRMESILARLDRDGDGRVDQTEFVGAMGGFDRLDTDGNGELSRAEMNAARQAVQNARQ